MPSFVITLAIRRCARALYGGQACEEKLFL